MNILFIINTLEPGGAEVFVLRLSVALQKQGHKVYIMPMYAEKTNKEFASLFSKHTISILSRYTNPSRFNEWLFWKMNAIAYVLGKKGFYSQLRKNDAKKYYKKIIYKHSIDVINSHLKESDYFATQYIKSFIPISVVLTLHSSYNKVNYDKSNEKTAFVKQAENIFNAADYIICVAEENKFITTLFSKPCTTKIEKVYIGYEKPEEIKEAEFKIDENKCNIIMVGRGIAEKGWEIAIQSFLLVDKKIRKHVQFLLICPKTEYIQSLEEKYKTEESVIFTGYQSNTEYYFSLAQFALLPSKSESLPVSIIEELSFGIPIIATNVGEINDMIQTTHNEYAGVILKHSFNEEQIKEEIAQIIIQYISNNSILRKHSNFAKQAFEKFSMDRCVSRYEDIFLHVSSK
ncbi:MAG: glycosyltransferase family 4 protein [Bacteroidales bacterium]|nr:glycosyltransferase family 4 protein [Bacteroidales bacterium]